MSLPELPISGRAQSGRGRDLDQQPQAGWIAGFETLTLTQGGLPPIPEAWRDQSLWGFPVLVCFRCSFYDPMFLA